MNSGYPPVPVLPDSASPEYFAQLLKFGDFLEQQTRPGNNYDLSTWPNPLWDKMQQRLEAGLTSFLSARVNPGQICMLQWYNSGILIKTAHGCLGFDLVPIPRYYGWPDPANLAEKLAGALDALLITHAHQDHFDKILVEKCVAMGKSVYSHPEVALAHNPAISACEDNEKIDFAGFSMVAHHGYHVWRENMSDVPLVYFEVICPEHFSFLFCGDADYTKAFACSQADLNTLFIPWRNPNSSFEEGHPQQTASTMDALHMAIARAKPKRIILEHYAELDHIYKGFTASYDLALNLIENSPVTTDIFFPGDVVFLKN